MSLLDPLRELFREFDRRAEEVPNGVTYPEADAARMAERDTWEHAAILVKDKIANLLAQKGLPPCESCKGVGGWGWSVSGERYKWHECPECGGKGYSVP